MTSRERILAAIRRQPLDRVPLDIWATQEVWGMLRRHFGEGADVREALHIDGFAGAAPVYRGPPLPATEPGETVDYWGIRRRAVSHPGGTYNESIRWRNRSSRMRFLRASRSSSCPITGACSRPAKG
jgi:uroporphyrinogen decarboxylase